MKYYIYSMDFTHTERGRSMLNSSYASITLKFGGWGVGVGYPKVKKHCNNEIECNITKNWRIYLDGDFISYGSLKTRIH